ncbi:DUF2530 domain-containing protein [Streptomonospora sp. S1-112]|uniref:DUF2530 domain-containing protein n=1 Tax=Streptomonospora mangrovi TaxID=2883123 RepID=A0A9X3SQG0_9ACTN|nr:DUF2530 domain-containing protein [Streptomonospora mangrovi]MDA0566636.1 DUF2530 domain-containing protein [Streptomonospora mangrovi]
MRRARKPDPEVLESDYRIPTALGTVGWFVAFAILVALGDRVPPADQWWRWVCVTGMAFGVFAYFYIPRLLRRRAAEDLARARAREERAAAGSPAAAEPAPGPLDSPARTPAAEAPAPAAEAGGRDDLS